MNDSFVGQISQAFVDLSNYPWYFIFRQRFLLLEKGVKISSFAKLSNYVAVIQAAVNIQTANNVLVRHYPQTRNLPLQQPASNFTLHFANSHLLDGNILSVLYVFPQKNLTETSLAHHLLQAEDIVLYLFAGWAVFCKGHSLHFGWINN